MESKVLVVKVFEVLLPNKKNITETFSLKS